MNRYDCILFDLDGTLTDPAFGITNSVSYALEKFGITVADKKELYKFIGPPLFESFVDFYGFTEDDASKAIAFYREYYSVKGIYENSVYPGITEMLGELKNAGKTLIVATSKPDRFAEQVLSHFGLDRFFEFTAGATMNETRTHKDEVIRYALEKGKITDKSRVIMVGDRKHDIIGAKINGIDSIGVLFGYGGLDELTEAGADYIAESVSAVTGIIIGK